ncbi:hypothetical protein CRG98_011671 [Punica granatum]|uniref:Zinc finger, CCHC-type n=1 Tax=Punica granatum TaxID=22663 RepID=A0A2I0KHS9_PUNGR|nr:hypothetical protein CRG98_011671 [Punica granatum]
MATETTTAFKVMNQEFVKLDRFDDTNFSCWKDKMLFLLTVLNVAYLLDPNLQPLKDPAPDVTPEEIAKVAKLKKKREEDKFTYLEGVHATKEYLALNFKMKDLNEVDTILGICRILGYLRKTKNLGLFYGDYPAILEGYSYASWITSLSDNKSTSGWIFTIGGGAISWASKKQTCISHSTMEAEFIALAAAGKEAELLRDLLLDIKLWPTT